VFYPINDEKVCTLEIVIIRLENLGGWRENRDFNVKAQYTTHAATLCGILHAKLPKE
jgi:hypothetical protein